MLLIDSAKIEDIDRLHRTGLFAGVTTNPSVLSRENMGFIDILDLHNALRKYALAYEFFQVVGDDYQTMLDSGRAIHELNNPATGANCRVIVKVPATRIGYQVANELIMIGAEVLLTAVYDPVQALAAEAIGCWGIAPYAGRLQDADRDPYDEIGMMVRILRGSGVRVLAASLRSPEMVAGLADAGVKDFTVSVPVLDELIDNPFTIRAAEGFLADEI